MNIGEIITALGGFSGLAAIILAMTERRKKQADYATQINEAAMVLIDPLKKRIQEFEEASKKDRKLLEQLRKEIDQLQSQNKILRRGIAVLIDQIRCLGHEPAFHLEDDDHVDR